MIKGKRVVLRACAREDISRWCKWFNDPAIRWFLARTYPYAEHDGEQYLELLKRSETDKAFSIETNDGIHIGSVGLHRIDWIRRSCDLGIVIGERDYRDKGYGTEAVVTLLDFAFRTMNLHRVGLRVYEFNPRAMACYRKAGFVNEGTLRQAEYRDGRYWDTHVMGMLESEFVVLAEGDKGN